MIDGWFFLSVVIWIWKQGWRQSYGFSVCAVPGEISISAEEQPVMVNQLQHSILSASQRRR